MDNDQNQPDQNQPPIEPIVPPEPSPYSPSESIAQPEANSSLASDQQTIAESPQPPISPFAPPSLQGGPQVSPTGLNSPNYSSPTEGSVVPPPQPVAFQTQIGQPQPIMSPSTDYQAPKKRGMSKGLLLGIIGGSVGLLLFIIGVIVALVLFTTPNHEDYSEANKKVSEIATQLSSLDSTSAILALSFDNSSTTEVVFNNDVDSAEEDIVGIKKGLGELKEMKAVKSGESKQKYDKLVTDISASVEWHSGAVVSMKASRGALLICDSVNSVTTEGSLNDVNNCISQIDLIKSMPNSDVKEYVSKIRDSFVGVKEVYEEAKTIIDPYGRQYSQYQTLIAKADKIDKNHRNARYDFQSNFEKHQDDIDVYQETIDMSDFLFKMSTR